ncbi:MAG: serine/threonine-protein kinase [Minicystis sp.]
MSAGLAEGTIFAGRYRVVRCIAAGGMGAVYEVIHLETERRRALKVMLPHVLQSEELRERFQREAKVAAHVESDYIVDVFDAGFDAATRMPFLAMELLRGEELGRRLKRYCRLPPADVVTYLHQTALALDKTHRANIVHRDLKPENLFLTERDDGPPRIKVLDFGIAKVIADSTTMGGATQSIGTPTYMAPEQLNPSARLTGAADRYALAMVAYTLLVGAPYWGEEARGGNVLALAMVTVHGPREPASARAARRGMTLPPMFDAWFARAAHVDPTQRFPTCVEMIAALADVLGLPSPRAAMMSWSGMTEFPQSTRGFDMTAAPMSAGLPLMTPSVDSGPAPITAPGTTATRPIVSTKPRSNVIIIAAAAGAFSLLVLAGVAVLALSRPRPAPAESAATTTPTAEPAPAASAEAPATATVTVAPSAPPTESPVASASATPKVETTATAPVATAKPVAVSAPQTAVPAAPKPPPVDPKRKKMWGRD